MIARWLWEHREGSEDNNIMAGTDMWDLETTYSITEQSEHKTVIACSSNHTSEQ